MDRGEFWNNQEIYLGVGGDEFLDAVADKTGAASDHYLPLRARFISFRHNGIDGMHLWHDQQKHRQEHTKAYVDDHRTFTKCPSWLIVKRQIDWHDNLIIRLNVAIHSLFKVSLQRIHANDGNYKTHLTECAVMVRCMERRWKRKGTKIGLWLKP